MTRKKAANQPSLLLHEVVQIVPKVCTATAERYHKNSTHAEGAAASPTSRKPSQTTNTRRKPHAKPKAGRRNVWNPDKVRIQGELRLQKAHLTKNRRAEEQRSKHLQIVDIDQEIRMLHEKWIQGA